MLFDADGVLQSVPAGWARSVRALVPDSADGEAFLADLFAAERRCILGAVDFPTVLADVLARWQSPVEVDEALRLWQQVEVDAAALALVDALVSAGITTALATNQHAFRAAYMRHELGYQRHFDRLLFSCEIGSAKPEPRFFAVALEQLSVRAGACLFIDDSTANVGAARAVGLAAELHDPATGSAGLRALLHAHGL